MVKFNKKVKLSCFKNYLEAPIPTVLAVFALVICPQVLMAETPFPIAKNLTADEAIWLEQELANCCKIEQWSLREGPLDLQSWTHKVPTPNGSHLLFIEELPGAHTQWYKVLHLSSEGHIKELSFAEPVALGDTGQMLGISVIDSAFNPNFDPISGKLTMWDFMKAGDISSRYTYQFVGDYGHEFVLLEYSADTQFDGQISYNQTISYSR